MPLTKHLYREDEVIAALKWCLLRGRLSEAAFWSRECVESEMKAPLLEALLWVWCFGCGASGLGWIVDFVAQKDPMELLCSLAHQCRRTPDSSVIAILGAGLRPVVPDHIGTPILPPIPPNFGMLEIATARCLIQGKVALAWNLLEGQWQDGVYSPVLALVAGWRHTSLEPVLKAIDSIAKNQKWLWPMRAIVVAAVSQRKLNLDVPVSTIPLEAGPREYAPPVDCLYWFTERGSLRVNESTESELMDGLDRALIGTYWDPLDKTDREEFYDRHFPFATDIPDEWSKAARAKSHGMGTVPVGDCDFKIIFDRCLLRWFGRIPSLSIWEGTVAALEVFSHIQMKTLEEGIQAAYSIRDLEHCLANLQLQPRRVEFIMSS